MIKPVGEPTFWKDVLAEAERTGDVPRVGGIDVSKALFPRSVEEFPLWESREGTFVLARSGQIPRAFAAFYADKAQSFFFTIEYSKDKLVITRAGDTKIGKPLDKIEYPRVIEYNIRSYFTQFSILGHRRPAAEGRQIVRFDWIYSPKN